MRNAQNTVFQIFIYNIRTQCVIGTFLGLEKVRFAL